MEQFEQDLQDQLENRAQELESQKKKVQKERVWETCEQEQGERWQSGKRWQWKFECRKRGSGSGRL